MTNICTGCKRSFRTVQGLGLHWDWQRRKHGPCQYDVGVMLPSPQHATVEEITAAVRAADLAFEASGGSSRHFVRECLMTALDAAGLVVVKATP